MGVSEIIARVAYLARHSDWQVRCDILFLILLVFISGHGIYFIQADNTLQLDHSFGLMTEGARTIKRFSENVLKVNHFLNIDTKYPPLVKWLIMGSFILFGEDPDSLLYLNLIFFAALLAATYLSGKMLYGAKVGLIASLIVSSSHWFRLLYLRYFFDELILSSVIAISFYLLLKSKGFSDTKYSLLYGMMLGITALIKWQFWPFVVGPVAIVTMKYGLIGKVWKRLDLRNRLSDMSLRIDSKSRTVGFLKMELPILRLFYLIHALALTAIASAIFLFLHNSYARISDPLWRFLTQTSPYKAVIAVMLLFFAVSLFILLTLRGKDEASNFVRSLSIAYIIAFTWYFFSMARLYYGFFLDANENVVDKYVGPDNTFGPVNLLIYLLIMANYQLNLVLTIVFMYFIVSYFLMRPKHDHAPKRRHADALLISWFVLGFLVFTLIKIKDNTLTLPYIPAVALFTVNSIFSLKGKVLKTALIILVVVLSVMNIAYIDGSKNVRYEIDLSKRIDYGYKRTDFFNKVIIFKTIFFNVNEQTDLLTDDVYEIIKARAHNTNDRVLVNVNLPLFSAKHLRFSRIKERENFTFTEIDNNVVDSLLNNATWLESFDFVILKNGTYTSQEKTLSMEMVHSIIQNSTVLDTRFKEIARLKSEDTIYETIKYELIIYGKI